MSANNFINSVVALCSAGMTNVAVGASAWILHGKLAAQEGKATFSNESA